jgi:hypothetical protein
MQQNIKIWQHNNYITAVTSFTYKAAITVSYILYTLVTRALLGGQLTSEVAVFWIKLGKQRSGPERDYTVPIEQA